MLTSHIAISGPGFSVSHSITQRSCIPKVKTPVKFPINGSNRKIPRKRASPQHAPTLRTLRTVQGGAKEALKRGQANTTVP